MKNIFSIVALCALLAGTAACSQEELLAPVPASDIVKIEAAVGGKSLFGRSNPVGTATEQAQFNVGDQIAVAADGQSEIIYTLTDQGWQPEAGKYLVWKSASMHFDAYYPVAHTGATLDGANNATATTFTLPGYQGGKLGDAATDGTGDCSHIRWADRMTFSGTITRNATDASASITFERQMARVVVKVSSIGNRLDRSKAVLTVDQINPGYIHPQQPANLLADGAAAYALVAPALASTTDSFIYIAVDSNGKGATTSGGYNENLYQLVVYGHPDLEAGKSYTVNLRVDKDTVAVENVVVDDWTSGTITGGDADVAPTSANPATNMVFLAHPGDLNPGLIATALSGGHYIAISGEFNDADLALLMNDANIINLNLGNTTNTTLLGGITHGAFGILTLPKNLKTLDSNSIANLNSIMSMALPASLTSIATNAVVNCSQLKYVNMQGTVPPTVMEKGANDAEKILFGTCPAILNVFVPIDAVGTYQATPGWANISSKILPINGPS